MHYKKIKGKLNKNKEYMDVLRENKKSIMKERSETKERKNEK